MSFSKEKITKILAVNHNNGKIYENPGNDIQVGQNCYFVWGMLQAAGVCCKGGGGWMRVFALVMT